MSLGPQFVGVAAANDPVERAGVRLGNLARGTPGATSNQKRTFKIMARVQGAWQGFRYPSGSVPADTDPTTLDTGAPASARTFAWQEYFKTDNTRQQTYEDVKEMDETTDEVSAALDTLADSSVNPEDGSQHTFLIEIAEGAYRDQAEAVFDQVTESLDLHRNAFSIAREFLKYGDAFCEMVVDEHGKLSRMKMLPVATIWRNEDASGNLMQGEPAYDSEGHCANEAGECAFDQREALNGRILAAFYAWQIIHFRWNHRANERYGRSMLRTARLVWKKLKAAEEALVIARLQRAWMRFVHYVDTTGMPREEARKALMDYRQELTRRFILDTQLRENPFEVTSDFYVSSGYIRDLDGNKFLDKKSKVEVLQGDHAVLAQITDIEYFQNKLFSSLRVPKAYLGFERDVNAKATLTTQDVQFARTLRRVQQVLSQGYKEIFDFALLLSGIDPAEVDYTVRWPAILVSDEERDAIIRRYHAQADAVYWQMGGISTKYVTQERFGMDDEGWRAMLLERRFDPPARVKPLIQSMPGDQQVDDDPTQADTAAQLANAIAGATTDDSEVMATPDRFSDAATATNSPAASRSASTTERTRAERRGTGGATQGPGNPANGTPARAGGGSAARGTGGAGEEYDPDADGGEMFALRDVWAREDDALAAEVLSWLSNDPAARSGIHTFVPGRQARLTTLAAEEHRARARRAVRSVVGVHAVSHRPTPTLPTAASVAGAEERHLADYLTRLVARRSDAY